jgi:hypothetical protein
MTVSIGMTCFGLLLGYITYRTLIRTVGKASIHDLTVVVAAIGGGAVTTLARPDTNAFGWYAIGLLTGFVAYAVVFALTHDKSDVAKVLGGREDVPSPARGPGAPKLED